MNPQHHNSAESPIILETHLSSAPMLSRGKVRDIYDLGEHLLIVATDRISAFDCILPNGIPGKGEILTAISHFWFERLSHITAHHVVATALEDFPDNLRTEGQVLRNRSMLVKRCEPVLFEAVVRGYLAGSGWKDYRKTGAVCGIKLPRGLENSAKLAEPIFTPATKASSGHDENVGFARMANAIGTELAGNIRDRSIRLYEEARDYANDRGIIIADTKFEWGLADGELILIDEVLTPDSSRFWPRDGYQAGRSQPAFDKQYVRDYLETCDWDKTPPAPALPREIVLNTAKKYREARDRLTGRA